MDISHELWKDYHFIGSTDRIHVFGRRPYISAIRNWEKLYPDCPKGFLTGKKPIREPLLYCGLCNNYVRNHEHKCITDGLWGPYPSDDSDTDFAIRIKQQSWLLFKISTSHCFEQYQHYHQYQPPANYYFYSTPIQKSKGTSYCSINSKSRYYSQQS